MKGVRLDRGSGLMGTRRFLGGDMPRVHGDGSSSEYLHSCSQNKNDERDVKMVNFLD